MTLIGGVAGARPRERHIDDVVDHLDRGVGAEEEATESGDEGVTVACVDVEKERLAIHPLDSEPGVELARRLQDERPGHLAGGERLNVLADLPLEVGGSVGTADPDGFTETHDDAS